MEIDPPPGRWVGRPRLRRSSCRVREWRRRRRSNRPCAMRRSRRRRPAERQGADARNCARSSRRGGRCRGRWPGARRARGDEDGEQRRSARRGIRGQGSGQRRPAGPARRDTRRAGPRRRPRCRCRAACASTRSGRATACRTRRTPISTETKLRVHPPASAGGPARDRGDQLRVAQGHSAAGRRGRPAAGAAADAGARRRSATRCWCRTARHGASRRRRRATPWPCSPRPATRSRSATSA